MNTQQAEPVAWRSVRPGGSVNLHHHDPRPDFGADEFVEVRALAYINPTTREAQWLPMKDAPRDGTKILVWAWEHKQAEIKWWDTSYSIHGLGGCWVPGTYGDMHLSGWLPADAILTEYTP